MQRKIGNIMLLGSSHIAQGSVQHIHEQFAQFAPDAVAIELDRARLHALLQKKKKTSYRALLRVGIGGFLFALVAQLMGKKLARMVGTEPGVDMLAAARLAGEHGKKVILADQPLEKTLQGISSLSFRKKIGMLWTTIKLMFDKKAKAMISLPSLSDAPTEEFVMQAVQFLENYYPDLSRVLLTERNHYIGRSLIRYNEQFPEDKVLVVLGAAHVPGVEAILRAKII